MNQTMPADPNVRIFTDDIFESAHGERLREYRLKWRDNPQDHVVERFPIHLDLESTSICNLKCPFCAGTHEHYDYGFMDFDLFCAIIDEGSDKGLYSIKLNFRGEPLLHPRIADMVAYAKQSGIVDVFFNTNATFLTDEIGEKLIHAGLDRLIVSFEGFTPEVYERNRVGANFEAVVENVRNFVRLKRQLGAKNPLLRLQTVAIDETSYYIEQYKEFWGEWADEITCIDLRDEQKDYSAVSSDGWECPYPWRRLCVTWDGVILTCPFVNRSLNTYSWQGFGRIGETTIEEVWCGTAMEQLREAHRTCASHGVEPCCYCSYRGTELAKTDLKDEP